MTDDLHQYDALRGRASNAQARAAALSGSAVALLGRSKSARDRLLRQRDARAREAEGGSEQAGTLPPPLSADVNTLKTEVEGLRSALLSRAVIEQAKGILIAQTGCSADEAFDMLARGSQRANRTVREIASEIVDRAQRQRRQSGPPPARGPGVAQAGDGSGRLRDRQAR